MNKKAAFSIIGVIVLLAGVGVGIFMVQRNQDIRRKAAPATNMSVQTVDSSPEVGDTFTVSFNINTGENQIIGAEMYIDFDPDILEAVEMEPGTFFAVPQEIGPAINNNAGTISYTIHITPDAEPESGSGTVAIGTFRAKSAGQASILLNNNTLVGGIGENGQNVLVGTTPLSLNVVNASGNPTSTPTPTPTGSPIGGTSPTPTSTAKATASASATPKGGTSTTQTATPAPTVPADVPVTGMGAPTVMLLGAALLLIPVGILLAL